MLNQILPASLFAVALVFVRIGAALMLLPGYSEPYIPPRMRLLLGLMIALIVSPVVAPKLPAMPASAIQLGVLILGEILIGVFFGTIGRLFLSALATAGMMVAYMSSMANALTNDPSAAQQGSIAGSFLTLIALLMIFALNLHHLMLAAVVDSYQLFIPGQVPPIGDLSDMITRLVSRTFLLSFQIAAPFIAVAMIFYLGLGLLARLMPQMQVFFVAIPIQITIGMLVMMAALPTIARWFADAFEQAFVPFAIL